MSRSWRIAWREGQFLRPQHFQQSDRADEERLRARLDSIRPYPWGLTELAIDEDLAALGKFAVLRARGVMPDGTSFSIPDAFPPPEPLDLPPDTRDALVSLTVPAALAGAMEFEERESAGVEIRYLVDEMELTDAYSDSRTGEPIELARPNLRFGALEER